MIELPNEIKVFITFLVTQGLKALANLFGFDFQGKISAVVAVVVGSIVFFIEGIIGLLPEEYQGVVRATLTFISVILGSFGTHYVYKNIGRYREIVKKID